MTNEASSRNRLGLSAVRALMVEAFRIYRERFFMIVPIVAVTQVPYILGLLLERAYGPETPVTFLLDIASNVLFLAMYGAVAHVVAQHIAQPTINVGEAYRRAVRRLLPMLGVEIIIIVLGGIAILVGVFFASQLQFASPRTTTIGLGVTIVLVAIQAGVRLFAVLAIVLFEGRSPLAALKGSVRLVRGRWWWVFSVLAAALIISTSPFVIGLLLGATTGLVGDFALEVVSILTIPVSVIAGTLLYFDLRVRSEGYSMDKLAEELEVGRDPGPR